MNTQNFALKLIKIKKHDKKNHPKFKEQQKMTQGKAFSLKNKDTGKAFQCFEGKWRTWCANTFEKLDKMSNLTQKIKKNRFECTIWKVGCIADSPLLGTSSEQSLVGLPHPPTEAAQRTGSCVRPHSATMEHDLLGHLTADPKTHAKEQLTITVKGREVSHPQPESFWRGSNG